MTGWRLGNLLMMLLVVAAIAGAAAYFQIQVWHANLSGMGEAQVQYPGSYGTAHSESGPFQCGSMDWATCRNHAQEQRSGTAPASCLAVARYYHDYLTKRGWLSSEAPGTGGCGSYRYRRSQDSFDLQLTDAGGVTRWQYQFRIQA